MCKHTFTSSHYASTAITQFVHEPQFVFRVNTKFNHVTTSSSSFCRYGTYKSTVHDCEIGTKAPCLPPPPPPPCTLCPPPSPLCVLLLLSCLFLCLQFSSNPPASWSKVIYPPQVPWFYVYPTFLSPCPLAPLYSITHSSPVTWFYATRPDLSPVLLTLTLT